MSTITSNITGGMFTIELDMSELESYMNRVDGAMDDIAAEAADFIYKTWLREARQRLNTSRIRYVSSIRPPEPSGNGYSVSLVGTFPVWVEEGKDPYDVGEVILNGPKVRRKEAMVTAGMTAPGQRYQRVPFKHTTSGAGFGASSAPTGYGYRTTPRGKAGVIPPGAMKTEAYVRAGRKNRNVTYRDIGRHIERGGYAGNLKPTHSRPIYSNMQPGGEGVGGTTFRTVNEDSQWLHPGIRARHIADYVVQEFEQSSYGASFVVTKVIQGLGGGL